MFVNTKAFKKLIKGAYNSGGLTVGATEEEYFFEGGSWVIRVYKEYLPKKEMAAVIELTGELPSSGVVFRAVKKNANQYLVAENSTWDIRKQFAEAKEKFNVTRAIYDQGNQLIRILQHKKSDTCVPISEVFIDLIDFDAMDIPEETLPEGPNAIGTNGYLMYWENNIMALAAGIIRQDEESKLQEYLSLLENVELQKKEWI